MNVIERISQNVFFLRIILMYSNLGLVFTVLSIICNTELTKVISEDVVIWQHCECYNNNNNNNSGGKIYKQFVNKPACLARSSLNHFIWRKNQNWVHMKYLLLSHSGQVNTKTLHIYKYIFLFICFHFLLQTFSSQDHHTVCVSSSIRFHNVHLLSEYSVFFTAPGCNKLELSWQYNVWQI